MSEFYLFLDNNIRLHMNEGHYSIVWLGDISIEALLDKERVVLSDYEQAVGSKEPIRLEVHYLTPNSRVKFSLEPDSPDIDKHEEYLQKNRDQITFARVDNQLFALWADIWENNGQNERSEVGFKLKYDFVDEVEETLKSTIHRKDEYTDDDFDKTFRAIKSVISGRYASLPDLSNLLLRESHHGQDML